MKDCGTLTTHRVAAEFRAQDWGPTHTTTATLAPQELTPLGSLETEPWHGCWHSETGSRNSRGTSEFPLQATNLGKWDEVGERNRERDVGQSPSLVPMDTWRHRSSQPAKTGARGMKICFSVCRIQRHCNYGVNLHVTSFVSIAR